MSESVDVVVDDRVATVRLDRPPANAIDRAVSDELRAAIDDAASRDDIGAIVIWGGSTLFAAGADITAMAEAGRDGIGPWVSALGSACEAVAGSPKVTIAAINGFALGAGCELAMACDLRYAADDAELAQPEVLLGVMPGAGGTQRLPRLVGLGRATEMILTGRRVSAREALSIGLVHRVVPPDDVYGAAVEAARGFARGPALALAAAKAAIGRPDADLAEGLEREREAFRALFDTHDQREGMAAFLEKRRPTFEAP